MNEDLRTSELGHTLTFTELRNPFKIKAIYGGVAWPGKRPGFAVVAAMDYEPHLGGHDIFLLDEYESFDMRKLIRQCAVLNLKYAITRLSDYDPYELGRWIGDYKNDAASRFIDEMNSEQERANRYNPDLHRERLSLSGTTMLEMENLYPYILPQIKDLLNPARRRLFLKDSKILGYLSEIEVDEIAELEVGSYPAVEAIAFAVIEMLNEVRSRRLRPRGTPNPWATGNTLTAGLRIGQKVRVRPSKLRM